jgi:hypothetical protein
VVANRFCILRRFRQQAGSQRRIMSSWGIGRMADI